MAGQSNDDYSGGQLYRPDDTPYRAGSKSRTNDYATGQLFTSEEEEGGMPRDRSLNPKAFASPPRPVTYGFILVLLVLRGVLVFDLGQHRAALLGLSVLGRALEASKSAG